MIMVPHQFIFKTITHLVENRSLEDDLIDNSALNRTSAVENFFGPIKTYSILDLMPCLATLIFGNWKAGRLHSVFRMQRPPFVHRLAVV